MGARTRRLAAYIRYAHATRQMRPGDRQDRGSSARSGQLRPASSGGHVAARRVTGAPRPAGCTAFIAVSTPSGIRDSASKAAAWRPCSPWATGQRSATGARRPSGACCLPSNGSIHVTVAGRRRPRAAARHRGSPVPHPHRRGHDPPPRHRGHQADAHPPRPADRTVLNAGVPGRRCARRWTCSLITQRGPSQPRRTSPAASSSGCSSPSAAATAFPSRTSTHAWADTRSTSSGATAA